MMKYQYVKKHVQHVLKQIGPDGIFISKLRSYRHIKDYVVQKWRIRTAKTAEAL